MYEWLLIDKVGDLYFFKDMEEIAKYTDLTKPQLYNVFLQSIKHYNKYSSRGLYIQRLFNNAHTHQRAQFKQDKYIYYIDDDGENQYGVIFNK